MTNDSLLKQDLLMAAHRRDHEAAAAAVRLAESVTPPALPLSAQIAPVVIALGQTLIAVGESLQTRYNGAPTLKQA